MSYANLEHVANTRNCRQKLQLSKGKAVPLQAWPDPSGSRRLSLPEFLDSRHIKVARLSVMRTGSSPPPVDAPILIFVRG